MLGHPELLSVLLQAETLEAFAAALEGLALGPALSLSREELLQAVQAARREHIERWLR